MAAALTQSHFRFGIDELAENTHGWHAPMDVNVALGVDVPFLLRFAVQETANEAASNLDLQFQYNLNGAGWVDITTSSVVVKAVAAAALTNNGNCTQRLTGTGTFESSGAGQTEDGLSGGSSNDVVASGCTETECGLQIVGSSVNNGDTIQFRLTTPDAFVITYAITPTLTIAKTPLHSGNLKIFHDLVNGSETIEMEGDSIVSGGGFTPGAIFRHWKFARLRGFGTTVGTGAGSAGIAADSIQSWQTTAPTAVGSEANGTKTGFCTWGKNVITFGTGSTVDAGDGSIYFNRIGILSIVGGSGQHEWFRHGNWLNTANGTCLWEVLTYEDTDSPDNCWFIQTRQTSEFASGHNNPKTDPWVRGSTGLHLRQFSTPARTWAGTMNLEVRATAGIVIPTGAKITIHGFRVSNGSVGAMLSIPAIGGSQIDDWIDTAVCSDANLITMHNLLGTSLFIWQGGANDTNETKAAYKAKVETYITRRLAIDPRVRVLLLAPYDQSSATSTRCAEFADAHYEIAQSYGTNGRVAFANVYAAMPPYDTMYQTRLSSWVSGYAYPAGAVVTSAGSTYCSKAAVTSATAPGSDSTNWQVLTGYDAANPDYFSERNNVLSDGTHPNRFAGGATWAATTWGLFAAGAQAHVERASRSVSLTYGSYLRD